VVLRVDVCRSVLQCAAMHIANGDKSRAPSLIPILDREHTPTQTGANLNRKSAKLLPNQIKRAAGKNDSRYWLSRIFRPINDRGITSPHYFMRLQFRGRRMGFSLGTANRDAAARQAAGIYNELLTLGPERMLAKRRAQRPAESIATVGEWIKEVRAVAAANPATFACYAASLRKIVGDILRVRRSKKRFGPRRGGAKDYRGAIDAASLEILAPSELQKWRLQYIKRAKTPAEERSRMTSCNSTLRQARSLFGKKIVRFLPEVRLPEPKPFEGVEFFPRQSAKYFSRIDAKTLLTEAKNELAEADSSAFLVMLLALSAGLRKSEIDTLCWHQVDFAREVIRVESTETASLKSVDSRGEVPIDTGVIAILRGYRARGRGAFVIEGGDGSSGPKMWGRNYRVQTVFDRVTAWLRGHGVTARKPLHELRKELGALITAEHGIYAASRVLRHADVSTTARHYTDLKTRPTIAVGDWLMTAKNVVPMKPASGGGKPRHKKARA
jgi:integrase